MSKQNEKLKAELLEELSEDISEQIEEEVDEEVREHTRLNKFKSSFIAVAAAIMALGQFSEAVTLIEDGIDSLRSRFTTTVEYDLLSSLHVSNTEAYVINLVGDPQVSRKINQDVVANYYYDKKFLLTVFIEDSRVSAYTYVPLISDFTPTIAEYSDGSWDLLVNSYSEFPANPKQYLIDHSKTISYYLENLDSGNAGLFVNNYLGNIAVTAEPTSQLLVELYDAEVNGSDEDVLSAQTRLRKQEKPNLYGRGNLPIELIQKSILTGAEFSSFFGQ